MPSKKILTPIEPGRVYHIYNRGIDRETVFYTQDDYELFYEKMQKYLRPVAEIYAYILLPNHYHMALRVKDSFDLEFSKEFGRMILSFTNTLNRRYERKGPFFHRTFRRRPVEDEHDLRQLITYIHLNGVKHGIHEDFQQYPFSSYPRYMDRQPTWLSTSAALWYFEDLDNFELHHQLMYKQLSGGDVPGGRRPLL